VEHQKSQEIYKMKLAHVTLTILSNQHIETIPFWKITWTPHHVVFHVDEADENNIVVYRADRIYELVTEDLEK
jgi:hypothetical protein